MIMLRVDPCHPGAIRLLTLAYAHSSRGLLAPGEPRDEPAHHIAEHKYDTRQPKIVEIHLLKNQVFPLNRVLPWISYIPPQFGHVFHGSPEGTGLRSIPILLCVRDPPREGQHGDEKQRAECDNEGEENRRLLQS